VLKLSDDITKGQCSQWQTDFKSWKEELLVRTSVGVKRAFQQQQPKSNSSFRTQEAVHEDGLENQERNQEIILENAILSMSRMSCTGNTKFSYLLIRREMESSTNCGQHMHYTII
jgi:hypothetical protein